MTSRPLRAYLIRTITIKGPSKSSELIVFRPNTCIRVDPSTNVAWIKQYQIEVDRRDYSVVC